MTDDRFSTCSRYQRLSAAVDPTHGLPVFSQDVAVIVSTVRTQAAHAQANVPFQIQVGVVDLGISRDSDTGRRTDLLRAPDLGWLMRVVGVDSECKVELAALVHACSYQRLPSNTNLNYRPSSGVMSRVKLRTSAGSGNVVFIVFGSSSSVRSGHLSANAHAWIPITFLNAKLGWSDLWLLFRCRLLGLLHGPDLSKSIHQHRVFALGYLP